MALKTRLCLSPWGWFQLHGHLEAQTADISLGDPVPGAPHLYRLEARSQDPGAEEQIEMFPTLPLSAQRCPTLARAQSVSFLCLPEEFEE